MFYFLHVSILGIGFCLVGWFLAAINAHTLVWLSLASVLVYLVNTQRGGLVIAHAWLAMGMAVSAVTRIWPSVWPSDIPYQQPRLWALILLVMWGFAATLLHALASAPQLAKQEFAQRPALRHRPPTLRLSSALVKPSTIMAVILFWVSGAIAFGAMTYALGVGT